MTDVEVIDLDGNTAIFQPGDEQAAQRVLAEAVQRGTVSDFSPVIPTLSEIYREVSAS
ncbi:DUF4162 domain-containing protein [Ornithinimicrobium sp. INDO-MA30-4]|uniref:ATP-binding protein DrrA1-3 family domain-containing protein n=1 Tax=Ornithinimicrobium sp. INDO-MA30-4 TaxID=2908651 RepID=UPI0037C75327